MGALCCEVRVKTKKNLLSCCHTVIDAYPNINKIHSNIDKHDVFHSAYKTIVICPIKDKWIWERGKNDED